MSPKWEWVVCRIGKGYLHENDTIAKRMRTFPESSMGLVRERRDNGIILVWLIGRNETWAVPEESVEAVDIFSTGDEYEFKICNLCHRYLPLKAFSRNQTNKRGVVYRPSCKKCRTDIDKRAPKTRQAKQMEAKRPSDGTPFSCPICCKRSIVGVTAKIVADHDHHTGNLREFICDSCNTGLGRFRNGEDLLQNAIEYVRERDSLNHRE